MGDQFERESGESAFESGLKIRFPDFQLKFREAGGENKFAGPFQGREFAGQEVGDLCGGDNAGTGGKSGGRRRSFNEAIVIQRPTGKNRLTAVRHSGGCH